MGATLFPRQVAQGAAAEAGSEGRMEKTSWRSSLRLAALFAAATFLLHFLINLRAQSIGYGLFRDELYYLVCGRHLDWGYVDQPPFVALAARASELVFGWHSLALFRVLPALAGGLQVAGTGLLAREMGGRRIAQVLAMASMMACPVTLGLDAILSMNVFEPLFWLGTAYGVLRAVRGDGGRWWLVAGVFAGIGLENKWNEVFFLLAMLAALLLLPTRKRLGRSFALCIAIILLLASPNLLWEWHRHWPTLVWLHNTASQGKNVVYGPLAFLWNQVFITGPVSSLLWISGVVWLVLDRSKDRSKDRREDQHEERREGGLRWMGLLYLLYLPSMILLHALDYYLAPVYPLLFAAGGVAWDRWLPPTRVRRLLVPAYICLVAVYGVVAIVSSQPVLTPPQYARYIVGSVARPKDPGTFEKSPLPELLADMTGWRDVANKLADVYGSLTPAEQARAVILTENYGEASAVNVYRPDVPTAVSGHQNYWYWGPRGHDGSIVIVFGGSRKRLAQEFGSISVAARTTNPWGQPFEAAPIYICRQPRQPLAAMWPSLRNWL